MIPFNREEAFLGALTALEGCGWGRGLERAGRWLSSAILLATVTSLSTVHGKGREVKGKSGYGKQRSKSCQE